jgi:K+-transporting ATPase ATPase C chain
MKNPFFTALKIILVFTLLAGAIYPLAITGIAQVLFPYQANGSIVTINGKAKGSELLGQDFKNPRYFWPRPSAGAYATVPSGSSNLGPTSDSLKKLIDVRRKTFIIGNKLPSNTVVPNDMLTASGSGLDPHISPESALLQINRICTARGYSADQMQAVKQLVFKHTENPQLGVFGDKRVNVFNLNKDLDLLKGEK